MALYRTCPDCGANLDPEELCDCQMQGTKENCVAAGQRSRILPLARKCIDEGTPMQGVAE